MSQQIRTYTELRQKIHDDLRLQHPEWVQPNGESPLCDSYEARLMETLQSLNQTERNNSSDAFATNPLRLAVEILGRHETLYWQAVTANRSLVFPAFWFRQMLWEARERQADFWAQESQGVAHDVLREPERMAKVQAAKLVCENTRWYTGKILKRVYGDDAAVNVDARTAVVVGDEQIKELRSRLNDARALVKQSGKNDAEP
jgi:hypothetical protein